eukprot:403354669
MSSSRASATNTNLKSTRLQTQQSGIKNQYSDFEISLDNNSSSQSHNFYRTSSVREPQLSGIGARNHLDFNQVQSTISLRDQKQQMANSSAQEPAIGGSLDFTINFSTQSSPSKGVSLRRMRSQQQQQTLQQLQNVNSNRSFSNIRNDFITDQELDLLQAESLKESRSNNSKIGATQFQKFNQDYQTPGLGNMGNTCFANSVIQCLTHTPHFLMYCMRNLHSQKCPTRILQTGPLMMLNSIGSHSCQMFMRSAVVQQLLNSEKFCSFCILEAHIKEIFAERERGTKFVYPLSAIVLIKKVAQGLFEVGRQCDASEFLLCLLENMIQASFGYLNNVPFKLQRETVVSKIFQGMLERQIICCSCSNMTMIEEAFLDLSLNIANTNNDQRMSHTQMSNQPVDFLDCISEFFKTDILDEQNKYHCQSCGRLSKAQTRFRMKNLPKVLIVHMKRFTHLGTKLKTPLNFPEYFSFDSDYLLEDVAFKEQQHQYKLYALIVHQGYSAHKGHYYSYIRPTNSDNWYKYDDESVKLIENLESQVLSTQKAYILFYQKIKVGKTGNQFGSNMNQQQKLLVQSSPERVPKGIPQINLFENKLSKSSLINQNSKIKEFNPQFHTPVNNQLSRNYSNKKRDRPPVGQLGFQEETKMEDFDIQITDTSSHEYQIRNTRRGTGNFQQTQYRPHHQFVDDPEDILRSKKQTLKKQQVPIISTNIGSNSRNESPTKISINLKQISKGPNSIKKSHKPQSVRMSNFSSKNSTGSKMKKNYLLDSVNMNSSNFQSTSFLNQNLESSNFKSSNIETTNHNSLPKQRRTQQPRQLQQSSFQLQQLKDFDTMSQTSKKSVKSTISSKLKNIKDKKPKKILLVSRNSSGQFKKSNNKRTLRSQLNQSSNNSSKSKTSNNDNKKIYHRSANKNVCYIGPKQ